MPLSLDITYDLMDKEKTSIVINGYEFKGGLTGLDLSIRPKEFARVFLQGISTRDTIKVNGRLFMVIGDQHEVYELIKVK